MTMVGSTVSSWTRTPQKQLTRCKRSCAASSNPSVRIFPPFTRTYRQSGPIFIGPRNRFAPKCTRYATSFALKCAKPRRRQTALADTVRERARRHPDDCRGFRSARRQGRITAASNRPIAVAAASGWFPEKKYEARSAISTCDLAPRGGRCAAGESVRLHVVNGAFRPGRSSANYEHRPIADEEAHRRVP
jgi:hypothetical protein